MFTLQRNMLFLILTNSKGCHISSIIVNCIVVQFFFIKIPYKWSINSHQQKNKTQKTINQGKDKERGNADAKMIIILLEHTKVILIFYTFFTVYKRHHWLCHCLPYPNFYFLWKQFFPFINTSQGVPTGLPIHV